MRQIEELGLLLFFTYKLLGGHECRMFVSSVGTFGIPQLSIIGIRTGAIIVVYWDILSLSGKSISSCLLLFVVVSDCAQ